MRSGVFFYNQLTQAAHSIWFDYDSYSHSGSDTKGNFVKANAFEVADYFEAVASIEVIALAAFVGLVAF